MSIKLINSGDILRLIDYTSAINCLRNAYTTTVQDFLNILPDRNIVEVTDHQALSLFMPGYIPSLSTLGIKISSIYPHNKLLGFDSVNGLTLLLDPTTGKIVAILDSRELTAIKTAAMSGLATDIVSSKEASKLAIIGSGKQARSHLLAMCSIRNFTTINIYSRNDTNINTFIKEMQPLINKEITKCENIQDAVINADVICTVTSYNESTPLIPISLINQYKHHINAVGGSNIHACEIDPQILKSSFIMVDHCKNALKEAGEITKGIFKKYITEKDIIEIQSVLSGQLKISNYNKVTIFKPVGSIFQDLIIGHYIYNKAIEYNIGNELVYFDN